MHHPDHDAPPINPLPPVVVALAVAIGLIEIAFQAGARGFVGGPEAIGWRLAAAQSFGFSDPMFEYMRATRVYPIEGLWRFVTYPFIHVAFTHAAFAIVLLLALGNFVSRVFGPVAILAVFFLSAIAGALAYGFFAHTRFVLLGAYPAVYGLLGLYTWLLWVAADEMGQNRWAAFRLIGVLVALQLIFVTIGGGIDGLYGDVAGFVTGFALATPAAPGGLRRLRARLQGR